jgi:hydroxymethylpyrimidine/phosphomethylpyrimidine kinase
VSTPRAVALTVAGSDSSGGAGIQADLKTFAALGVFGASAVTALTAQSTLGVTGVHVLPPDFVRAQIDAVCADLPIAAVKTGMLASRDTVLAVAAAIDAHRLPNLVVDPVMVATSGASLIADDAVTAMRAELLPRARLVTPNLAEAARLLGVKPAANVDEMIGQAAALRVVTGAGAVLLKGGHGAGPEAVDILVDADGVNPFALARLDVGPVHGTGCTLSAAICARLAQGARLRTAVGDAKRFVWATIEASRELRLGHGAAMLDHALAGARRG